MRRALVQRSLRRLLDANTLEDLFQVGVAERAVIFAILSECASGTPGRFRAAVAAACRRAGTSESYFMDRVTVLLASVVERQPDFYHLLGVEPSATQEEIRARWRQLVKGLHPDVGGDPEAFLVSKRAYETLADPEKRRRYQSRWLQQVPALQHAALLAQLGPPVRRAPSLELRRRAARVWHAAGVGIDRTVVAATAAGVGIGRLVVAATTAGVGIGRLVMAATAAGIGVGRTVVAGAAAGFRRAPTMRRAVVQGRWRRSGLGPPLRSGRRATMHVSARLRRSILAASVGLALGALAQDIDAVRWLRGGAAPGGWPAAVVVASLEQDTVVGGAPDRIAASPAPRLGEGVASTSQRANQADEAPDLADRAADERVPNLAARVVAPVEVAPAAAAVAPVTPVVAAPPKSAASRPHRAPSAAKGASRARQSDARVAPGRDAAAHNGSPPSVTATAAAAEPRLEGGAGDRGGDFISTAEVLDFLEWFQQHYREMSAEGLARLFAPSASENDHAGRTAIAQAYERSFEALQAVDYRLADVAVQTVGRQAAATAAYTIDFVGVDGSDGRVRGMAQWWLRRRGPSIEILRLEHQGTSP